MRSGAGRQKITNMLDYLFFLETVRFNVLAVDVRDEFLIPEGFRIHHNKFLVSVVVLRRSKMMSTDKYAQFQGHIEAGKLRVSV